MMQVQLLLTWQEIKNILKTWNKQESTTKIFTKKQVFIFQQTFVLRISNLIKISSRQQKNPFGGASEGFFVAKTKFFY